MSRVKRRPVAVHTAFAHVALIFASPALAHSPSLSGSAARDAPRFGVSFSALPERAADGDMVIAALLALALLLYLRGVVRLWRSASIARGIDRRQVASFVVGEAMLALALLGSLDDWAHRSFAAHMLQHEALMLIAAPLLVAGRPLAALTWALAPDVRRRVRGVIAAPAWRRTWGAMTGLAGATLLQLVALFVWHVPRLFDYASAHWGVHVIQHTTFLVTALCFWWAARVPRGTRAEHASRSGVAIVCVFTTMLATGGLGAFLTFARGPWYGAFAGDPLPWATSALEDQQLGGLLMWVPGGVAYLIAGLMHAARLLSGDGHHADLGAGTSMRASAIVVHGPLSAGRER